MKYLYQHECPKCHVIKSYSSKGTLSYIRHHTEWMCKQCRLATTESLNNLKPMNTERRLPDGVTQVEMQDTIMWCRICPTCQRKVYHARKSGCIGSFYAQADCKQCCYKKQIGKTRASYNLTAGIDNPGNLVVGALNTVEIPITAQRFGDYIGTQLVTFKVVKVSCPKCGYERIRKIPMIDKWYVACWKCQTVFA